MRHNETLSTAGIKTYENPQYRGVIQQRNANEHDEGGAFMQIYRFLPNRACPAEIFIVPRIV